MATTYRTCNFKQLWCTYIFHTLPLDLVVVLNIYKVYIYSNALFSHNCFVYPCIHLDVDISFWWFMFPYSERGFCDIVTLALVLHVTGHQQTSTPPLLVPDPLKRAAGPVPGRERGVYAPSRTSSLHCRSFTRSGAAGTPPVPSPSWWTASVHELLLRFIHRDIYSLLKGGLISIQFSIFI